jgi:hypothetical protein
MSMKKSGDTIGNRTRNLPVFSAVPQPVCHHVPQMFSKVWKLSVCSKTSLRLFLWFKVRKTNALSSSLKKSSQHRHGLFCWVGGQTEILHEEYSVKTVDVVADGHLTITSCKRHHFTQPARSESQTSHSFWHNHSIDTRICEAAEVSTSFLFYLVPVV